MTGDERELLDGLHRTYDATPEGLEEFMADLRKQRPDCFIVDVVDNPNQPYGETIPFVDGKGDVHYCLNVPSTSEQ